MHAILLGRRPSCEMGPVDWAAAETESGDDADGKEDERCCSVVAREAEAGSTELRGTPHNPHIFAAAGLSPGGLRYAQSSHSQLSNSVPRTSLEPGKGPAELPVDKWRVTLGEDLKRPA